MSRATKLFRQLDDLEVEYCLLLENILRKKLTNWKTCPHWSLNTYMYTPDNLDKLHTIGEKVDRLREKLNLHGEASSTSILSLYSDLCEINDTHNYSTLKILKTFINKLSTGCTSIGPDDPEIQALKMQIDHKEPREESNIILVSPREIPRPYTGYHYTRKTTEIMSHIRNSDFFHNGGERFFIEFTNPPRKDENSVLLLRLYSRFLLYVYSVPDSLASPIVAKALDLAFAEASKINKTEIVTSFEHSTSYAFSLNDNILVVTQEGSQKRNRKHHYNSGRGWDNSPRYKKNTSKELFRVSLKDYQPNEC